MVVIATGVCKTAHTVLVGLATYAKEKREPPCARMRNTYQLLCASPTCSGRNRLPVENTKGASATDATSLRSRSAGGESKLLSRAGGDASSGSSTGRLAVARRPCRVAAGCLPSAHERASLTELPSPRLIPRSSRSLPASLTEIDHPASLTRSPHRFPHRFPHRG